MTKISFELEIKPQWTNEIVHDKCGSNSSIMDFSGPKVLRTKLWELWSLLIDNHPLKPVMDLVKFNNSLREAHIAVAC